MDTFEYLSVLVSVVIGLAVVHVLQGAGRLVSRPGPHKLYWVHSVWVIQSLAWVINFWWFQLGYRPVEQWSSALFIFVLLYAIALYLQCVIIVPDEVQPDYEEYFYSRRRWFFSVLILIRVLDTIDSYLKPLEVYPNAPDFRWGFDAAIVAVVAAPFVVAIYTKKRWYHAVLSVLWLFITVASLLGRAEPGGEG